MTRRAPTESEENLFFSEGLYSGHFRFTDEHNCSLVDNCKGDFMDFPCGWSTFATPQAFYHDIRVESRGPLEPNGGYSYNDLVGVMMAANATKSAAMFYWWTPEALHQRFLGTDAELLHVQLRPPSQACVENRASPEARCSDDYLDRIADEVGSCDGEPHSLLKILVSSLSEDAFAQEEAERSPAYAALKGLTLSELQLGDMLDLWYNRGIDTWNYDPREVSFS